MLIVDETACLLFVRSCVVQNKIKCLLFKQSQNSWHFSKLQSFYDVVQALKLESNKFTVKNSLTMTVI